MVVFGLTWKRRREYGERHSRCKRWLHFFDLFCLHTLPLSFAQEMCSDWLVPKGFSDVLLFAVVLAFIKVVMDIPMPGHPHQSAEVLHGNVAAWDGIALLTYHTQI